MSTPIYDSILKYINSHPTSFHMPGHKFGSCIPEHFIRDLYLLDLTEIPGTDNLHLPESCIKDAQDLASHTFGTDETFFLVNGSTCGIHAAILSTCNPGDKLIVARNCHKSVINGLILAKVEPIYINTQFNDTFGIPLCIELHELDRLLQLNPDCKGVIITSPNYYGICQDIHSISNMVHSHGKILIVDEAHGAHLKFNSKLPICAMDGGADICIQSAHKTLPALTQGAYLHVKYARIDIDRLKFNLQMLQTSSPSYLIMSSLDIARHIMQEYGSSLLDKLIDNITWFKNTLYNVPNNHQLLMLDTHSIHTSPSVPISFDNTRLVINVRKLGLTGFQVDKILRRNYNLQVEMSDLYSIICISTISNTRDDFRLLYSALSEIVNNNAPNNKCINISNFNLHSFNIPEKIIPLYDAVKYRGTVTKLHDSIGRISKSMITPYPPGVPIICPGEIIDEATVSYLLNIISCGGIVNGINTNGEIEIIGGVI